MANRIIKTKLMKLLKFMEFKKMDEGAMNNFSYSRH